MGLGAAMLCRYGQSKDSGEKLAEDVVDGLGIGLAASGAHDLTNEEFEDAFVAGLVLGDVVGILGDDFARSCFDGGFADLGTEAFGGDDVGGRAAGFEHSGEDLFADVAGNFTGFDKADQLRERLRADGACFDLLAGIVEAAEKLGLHPVGGGFAGSAGFHNRFEIIGEGLRAGEDFGVAEGH